jgi:hypothetical protein
MGESRFSGRNPGHRCKVSARPSAATTAARRVRHQALSAPRALTGLPRPAAAAPLRRRSAESLRSRRPREERVRRQQADQLVNFGTQRLACWPGRHRHGHHQTSRVSTTNRTDRGQHGCPGRKAVVDQDHCPTGEAGRRTSPAQSRLAAAGLGALLVGQNAEHPRGHAEFSGEYRVQEPRTVGGHRSEGELRLDGGAHLSRNYDIQLGPERTSNLRSHGHATARNAEHQHVLPAVCLETVGEPPPGVASINEFAEPRRYVSRASIRPAHVRHTL